MGSRWGTVVVDAVDPNRLARWWAEVLEYRLLSEAARRADVGQPPGAAWVVLADPEGNEFCVLPPDGS